MSLVSTLNFILAHPLTRNHKARTLVRFVLWQLRAKIISTPKICSYAEKSKLLIKKGMAGATGNLYCGLHEFEDMAFVLHFLRQGDCFIDIGANIGSYAILGAGEVGADTIAIEPVPQTFMALKTNIALNNLESNVNALNIGLGNKKGILKFTNSLDTVNHVATEQETDTIDVQIEKFDDIINITKPTLIKMDVEGFETEVLKGMEKALQNKELKGIIIELNGSGGRYGYNEEEIHRNFLEHGFKAFLYSPFERKLIHLEKFGGRNTNYNSENTIYIKDVALAQERIVTAKKFKILDEEF